MPSHPSRRAAASTGSPFALILEPEPAGSGLWAILGLGLVSTALPYALFTIAQRFTTASAAAVIVSAREQPAARSGSHSPFCASLPKR